MNVGLLFLLCVAIIGFLEGVGIETLPRPMFWCFFFLAIGIMTSGIPVPWRKAAA